MEKKQYPLFEIKENVKIHSTQEEIMQPIDKPHKTIRIAVSGDVILTQLEMKIIDTPDFQRLRKYRQLGTSFLVYPSAHHTRFEHSLGVLKIVDTMMSLIQSNAHSADAEKQITPKQIRLARLAALLHDIANIPFGHTLEDETKVISSYQEDKSRIEGLIGEDTVIGKILHENLDDNDPELLINILTSKKDPENSGDRKKDILYISELKENAFLVDLIKNTVCADLLDYLARDTYFCGLPLSVPERFLNYLYLDTSDGVKRVAIRLWKPVVDHRPRTALISELIQLLETRYFLAERVYFHHAKQISSAMIASAVWHAQHQAKNSLSYKKLSQLGDDDLIVELQDSKKYPLASKLAKALADRKLYKRFYALPRWKVTRDPMSDNLAKLKEKYHSDAENRINTEYLLSSFADIDDGDVLIYCPDPDMNLKEAKMNVTSKKGGIEQFYKIDDSLIQEKMKSLIESHKGLWELQVFVKQESLDSQHKTDLLEQACKLYFEDSSERAERNMYSSVILDIERQAEDSYSVDQKDHVIEEAMAIMRDGKIIDRDYFKKNLQK
jgi:HD superfamily phosphohydrolase